MSKRWLTGLTAAAGIFAAFAVHAVEAVDVNGAKVYLKACAMCHKTGSAGAPKTGDLAAWEARIAQGLDVLHERAIKGFKGSKGLMPPKGGRSDLSDDEVRAAVIYIVEQSGGVPANP